MFFKVLINFLQRVEYISVLFQYVWLHWSNVKITALTYHYIAWFTLDQWSQTYWNGTEMYSTIISIRNVLKCIIDHNTLCLPIKQPIHICCKYCKYQQHIAKIWLPYFICLLIVCLQDQHLKCYLDKISRFCVS